MLRIFILAASSFWAANAFATVTVVLAVDGTDAIQLAGRSDLSIPNYVGPPSWALTRHSYVLPTFRLETYPDLVAAGARELFTFEATGCVHFVNGDGCPDKGYGPDGSGTEIADIDSFGGVSGYVGPAGSLVGVFLMPLNPALDTPPSTLAFTPSELGTDFLELHLDLRQIFFIGDGRTSSGVVQRFYAPSGPSQLWLGVADAFGFLGAPGAFEDNDGSYVVSVTNSVPESGTLSFVFFGMITVCLARYCRLMEWRVRS